MEDPRRELSLTRDPLSVCPHVRACWRGPVRHNAGAPCGLRGNLAPQQRQRWLETPEPPGPAGFLRSHCISHCCQKTLSQTRLEIRVKGILIKPLPTDSQLLLGPAHTFPRAGGSRARPLSTTPWVEKWAGWSGQNREWEPHWGRGQDAPTLPAPLTRLAGSRQEVGLGSSTASTWSVQTPAATDKTEGVTAAKAACS